MGFTNAGVGVSQIIFSRVYDSFNNGSPEGRRGMQMLLTTASISFISVIAYGVLIPLWPKEDDEKKKKKEDEEYENFSKWDALTDYEWSSLPMETVDKVATKDGKVNYKEFFGWLFTGGKMK